jgi:hypothetical protein
MKKTIRLDMIQHAESGTLQANTAVLLILEDLHKLLILILSPARLPVPPLELQRLWQVNMPPSLRSSRPPLGCGSVSDYPTNQESEIH